MSKSLGIIDEEQKLSRLAKDFHEMVCNKEVLKRALDGFLNNLIDELSLGIIFDLHRKYKTHSYEVDAKKEMETIGHTRGTSFAAKDLDCIECVCPICGRSCGYSKFAPHLRGCMGFGRKSKRNATWSNNRDRETPSFTDMANSDDDDDVDWNSANKRSKKRRSANGNKRPKGGTPKKADNRNNDANLEVVLEHVIDHDLVNLRELSQENSNGSTSSSDFVSSNHSSSSRKRDKSKNKKN